MSLRRAFVIDGQDFSAHIIRESMIITYEPIKGLPDVWTEDLTLHDDLLGYRRVITVSPDVMDETQALTLISALRKSTVNVYMRDPAKNEYETIVCQPELPSVKQRLARSTGEHYWQLSPLVLKERSGVSDVSE